MKYDLCITNALVIDEHTPWRGHIAVRNGKIAAHLAADTECDAVQLIDAGGLPVLPGLIDAHVHFNEPGRSDWEGFACGSMGAAAGGITTVIDMPLNNLPAVVDAATLAAKQAAVATQSVVDYCFWGGLVTDNVAHLAEQDALGAVAYKAFMSNSGIDDFLAVTDGVLLAGLRHAARSGKLVGVHAESEALTAHLAAVLHASGRTDRRAWLESRPPFTEAEAINRALLLAQEAQARLHIVHISTPDGVDRVATARQLGVAVTCETCPHFLTLDANDFVTIGPTAKCAPPLRERALVEELWARVLAGQVDLIASDHSPCPTDDKTRGDNDIWSAWGGISGVQTMLPLILHEGVYRRRMALPQLVQLMSSNPARLFGFYPRKGSLQIGADADMVIIDPDQVWTVQPSRLFARHKHTPFAGRQLHGQVRTTVLRGQVVYHAEHIQVAPGYGQLLTSR